MKKFLKIVLIIIVIIAIIIIGISFVLNKFMGASPISDLQRLINQIDHKNNGIDKYFYKLSEEVGEYDAI